VSPGSRQQSPAVSGLNVYAEAELGQIVCVVDGGIIKSILALRPVAELSTEFESSEEELVQPGDREQPACVWIESGYAKVRGCVGFTGSVGRERLGSTVRTG